MTATPRTLAFSYHLMLFVRARWLAATAAATAIAACKFIFGFDFPYVWLTGIVAAMLGFNAVMYVFVRSTDFHEEDLHDSADAADGRIKARRLAWIQIVADLIALFGLLHFTGGLENPFFLAFTLHMVVATVLLEIGGVVVVFLLISALLFGLGIAEHFGWLAHYHQPLVFGGFEPVDNWAFVLGLPAVATVMNVCLAALTFFMMNAINRRRDRILALTRELEAKNARLTELDDRRKKTMALVSHDMKSPIDAVSNYLTMLLEGYVGPLTDEQRNILSKSAGRLKRLRAFVGEVLDWQTIEHGELRQHIAPMDLRPVLDAVAADYKDAAADRRIALSVEAPSAIPVLGSAPRLKQVFDNLVSNAVKYTEDGGSVRVVVTRAGDRVQVRVQDTGIGMTPDEVARVFEDFYRSPRVKHAHEGTGLGMSMVKRVIDAHDGTIAVDSAPGRGTSVTVELRADPGA